MSIFLNTIRNFFYTGNNSSRKEKTLLYKRIFFPSFLSRAISGEGQRIPSNGRFVTFDSWYNL